MKTNESKQAHWEKHIMECQASGEPAQIYCQRHGLKYNTYQYWKSRLRFKEQQGVNKVSTPFVPVEIKPNAVEVLPELFLRVGGFEVLIRRA